MFVIYHVGIMDYGFYAFAASFAMVAFCILEAGRGILPTEFHALTQKYVRRSRHDVELSHISLLISTVAFPAYGAMAQRQVAAGLSGLARPADSEALIVPPSYGRRPPSWSDAVIHASNSGICVGGSRRLALTGPALDLGVRILISCGALSVLGGDTFACVVPIVHGLLTGEQAFRLRDFGAVHFVYPLIPSPWPAGGRTPDSQLNNLTERRQSPDAPSATNSPTAGPPPTHQEKESDGGEPYTLVSRVDASCEMREASENRTLLGSLSCLAAVTSVSTIIARIPLPISIICGLWVAIYEAVGVFDNLELSYVFSATSLALFMVHAKLLSLLHPGDCASQGSPGT